MTITGWLAVSGFGDDEGEVVVLFVGDEEAHFVDEGIEHEARRLMAMAVQRFNKTFFPELIADIIERFNITAGCRCGHGRVGLAPGSSEGILVQSEPKNEGFG